MNKVKFNTFSEILEEDFNRQAEYTGDSVALFINDFLTADMAVVLSLEVKAQAVADMTVYVAPGRLYQAGKQGEIKTNSNPPLKLTAADPNYARIDRVCARYAEVDDEPETRNVMIDTVSRQVIQKTVMTRIAGTIEFMVVSGAAAPVPAAPTVPDGWISLAQISVKQNATGIVQENILDERPTISAYLKHKHTGGGDGARLDYKNISGIPDLATQTVKGLMSPTDKVKLDGIANGAEVNQNAYVSARVGGTYINATGKTDTLTFAAGQNIAITPDVENKKVTVGVTGIANGAEPNQKAFSTIQVGTTKIPAAYTIDTLNIVAGKNITVIPDVANRKVSIAVDGDLGLNLLQRSKAYKVGDIAYSAALPSWAYLECVKAGTTGSSEPNFTSISNGGGVIPDYSCTWLVMDIRDGTPVGRIVPDTCVRAGYVKANGATAQRETYPRLVAFAEQYGLWTTDVVAYPGLFGKGNGSTTFVLPDYRGYFDRYLDEGKGLDLNRALGSEQKGTLTAMDINSATPGTYNLINKYVTNARDGNASIGADMIQNYKTYGQICNQWANKRADTVYYESPITNRDEIEGCWGQTRPKNIARIAVIKY